VETADPTDRKDQTQTTGRKDQTQNETEL